MNARERPRCHHLVGGEKRSFKTSVAVPMTGKRVEKQHLGLRKDINASYSQAAEKKTYQSRDAHTLPMSYHGDSPHHRPSNPNTRSADPEDPGTLLQGAD